MKKSGQRGMGWYLIVVLGLMSYFFRSNQLSGGSILLCVAFSILCVLGFALCAAALAPGSAYSALFVRDPAEAVFSIPGALLLGAGAVMILMRGSTVNRIVGALGVLAAAGLVIAAVGRLSSQPPRVFPFVLAVLFYIVRLFFSFRGWMLDPAILDYCFQLLAMISFMLASYFAGEYCFDKGRRRLLCFFALTGVFFGASALAGAETAELLIYGGSTLWMLALCRRVLTA